MTQIYYKWLKPDRTTTYQGVKWPKRVGVWTPDETPKLCASGWHLATHQGIAEHARKPVRCSGSPRDVALRVRPGQGGVQFCAAREPGRDADPGGRRAVGSRVCSDEC